MGVFFAGDFLTLLLFFELMTIASYFWVVHRRDREAIRAGYFYLFFSLIGGLCVGLGIVLIGTAAGRVPTVGGGPLHPLEPRLFKYGIAALLAGFGIKAGMVPLHLWLPHAHSTAPTPGSALLSGLLIKVGAYGLIRTGELAGWGIPQAASTAPWLGTVLIILGVCTMLAGVAAALLQNDAKRLLAYHSVSQMGYIILGLGLGLYLGSQGGLGLVGAIYHIVNHALFKAALFLGVGHLCPHPANQPVPLGRPLAGLSNHSSVDALGGPGNHRCTWPQWIREQDPASPCRQCSCQQRRALAGLGGKAIPVGRGGDSCVLY